MTVHESNSRPRQHSTLKMSTYLPGTYADLHGKPSNRDRPFRAHLGQFTYKLQESGL